MTPVPSPVSPETGGGVATSRNALLLIMLLAGALVALAVSLARRPTGDRTPDRRRLNVAAVPGREGELKPPDDIRPGRLLEFRERFAVRLQRKTGAGSIPN